MSSLAELFASVGYKVDEESIKRYDAALEASKAKTQAMDEQSQALLKRMADLKAARDQEAAQVKSFIKLQEELFGKQETDEEKKANVAKAMDVVGFAAKSTGQELSKSEKQAKDWEKTVVALEAGLNLASSAFGFVRGKIQGMFGALKAEGGAAGSLVSLSTRTGIATEALQELGYAASQNGSDLNVVAGGLKAFTNKADAAAAGSKAMAKTLREVGVSAKDLKSGKLSLDDALGKVADKFKTMPDGAKKTALAMDLFGGAGGSLVPLLNQGSDGITKLREEARKLGVVLTDDAVKGLAGFDDQSSKLQTSVDGLRKQALAAIIPELTKVIEKFQEWLGENREEAVAALTAGFEILVGVISSTADVITTLTPLITLVAENMDLVTQALAGAAAGFVVYKAAAIVASLGSVAAARSAAAAWIAANWPFVALGVAVALVIKYWPQIKAGAQAAGRAIRDAFVAAKDAVVDTFTDAYEWVVEKIELLQKKWEEFKDVFSVSEDERLAAVDAASNTGFEAYSRSLSVPSSAAPSSSGTTIQNTITIPVTSNSADPVAVAKAVPAAMETFWNRKMQQLEP